MERRSCASFESLTLCSEPGGVALAPDSKLAARFVIFWISIEPLVSTESTMKEPSHGWQARGNARIALHQSPVTHRSEVS